MSNVVVAHLFSPIYRVGAKTLTNLLLDLVNPAQPTALNQALTPTTCQSNECL